MARILGEAGRNAVCSACLFNLVGLNDSWWCYCAAMLAARQAWPVQGPVEAAFALPAACAACAEGVVEPFAGPVEAAGAVGFDGG